MRYIVVRAPTVGADAYLQISQVTAWAGGFNIAFNKPCTSSSQADANSGCALTVDGNAFPRTHPGMYLSAAANSDWVKIDLLADFPVTGVGYVNALVALISVAVLLRVC